jgi:proton-dependent oligopeptide transporter, POT family
MKNELLKNGMPKAVPFIIGNEAAERFSFYGIRSVMSTFLVAQFFNPAMNPVLQGVAEARSNEMVHLFVTVAYFMPLVGGILADWFFGKYKVILYVSIFYTIGNLLLAFSTRNMIFFTIGLIVIATAAGGIKSCVSANVGDQFDSSNNHLLSKIYGWFYFAINTGSVASTIFIPVVYNKYGAELAFGIPGILMCVATLIFWLGRKKYVRVPPSGIKKENFTSITGYAIIQIFANRNGMGIWEAVGKKFSAASIDGVKAVYRILMVFFFTPIFWAMWDQNLAEWVLQAKKLDLSIFGYTLFAEQIQTFNPVFLISMIPVMTYVVYPLYKKLGFKVTPLRKIGAGLLLTALTFIIIALVQESVDKGGHPTVWWQVFAYFWLSVAEILVSITCLEYAYTHSPKSMKSTMSALYLLTISLGNYFDSLVNKRIANNGFFIQYTGAKYYWLFTDVVMVFFIVYIFVAKRLPEKSYVRVQET